MGGGYLELQHKGIEDAFFIRNPQITFFKSVYRRFSNFSIEPIRNEFENSTLLMHKAKRKVNCKVRRLGDLVNHVTLSLTLPELKSKGVVNGDKPDIKWVKNVGCAAIEKIDFLIESQVIESISGRWLHLYNEIYSSSEEKEAFRDMASYDNEIDHYINDDTNSNPTIPEKELLIPIPFWFSKTTGHNFPLLAVSKNHVHIQVTFKAIEDIIVMKNESGEWVRPSADFKISDYQTKLQSTNIDLHAYFSLMYIFLEDNERDSLVRNIHTYTICTTQYGEHIECSTESKLPIRIKHPIKELIWVCQRNDAIVERNDWFNYTNFKDSTKFKEDENKKNILKSAQLLLNTNPRFGEHSWLYFNKVQPYIFFKKKIPEGVYMFNFGLKPLDFEQPSGMCNASAFSFIDLKISLQNPPESTPVPIYYNAYVFAVSYNQLRIMSGFGALQFVN